MFEFKLLIDQFNRLFLAKHSLQVFPNNEQEFEWLNLVR